MNEKTPARELAARIARGALIVAACLAALYFAAWVGAIDAAWEAHP